MVVFSKNMVGKSVFGIELNRVVNPKEDTEMPSWEALSVWSEPWELLRELEAEDRLRDVASEH